MTWTKKNNYDLDENAFGTFYEAGPNPYNPYGNYKDMFGKSPNHPGMGKRGPEHLWRADLENSKKEDAPFIYVDLPLDLPMMGF